MELKECIKKMAKDHGFVVLSLSDLDQLIDIYASPEERERLKLRNAKFRSEYRNWVVAEFPDLAKYFPEEYQT